MLAACQAADKALLLAGLIRKTTDSVRLTVGGLEGMIAKMEAERDKTQPHWRDAKSHNIEREMERLKAELERKVASELFEEINRPPPVAYNGSSPADAA